MTLQRYIFPIGVLAVASVSLAAEPPELHPNGFPPTTDMAAVQTTEELAED